MRPRVLHKLLTLILALALGASGPLRASAHGHPADLTAMVICGEEGTKTVYLDAEGNPVTPDEACLAEPCTACLPSAPADIGPLVTLAAPPDRGRTLAPLPVLDSPALRRTTPVKARGPPIGDDLP